ncbi:hypothetical protein [Sulfuricurvum sp.]|uniref:hypothetical protein n=1 Tax=Sulfuricurvum sp. TaxID=2025608 RepID=UPI00260B90F5|nr:hypothetical protein [Sulfuricurvum sp.]MDD3597192.1 hypothetical protein [Sulfuricurvum sp.]
MKEKLGVAKFPTKGFILDTVAQGFGIKFPRKDIQRLIKEESISAENAEALINHMIDQIVESITQRHAATIKSVLAKFLHFYTDFTIEFEVYKVSQKQLDYLLLKDLFIPLVSDIMAVVFEEDISILSAIKPDSEKMPIQKMFDWVKQHIPEQKSFLNYLVKKHEEDTEYTPSYNTVRNNLNGWMSDKDLSKVDSIKRLTAYIQNDIEDEISHKLIKPLFLAARSMQKGYKSLLKIYDQIYVDMLVEHFYLLLKFHLWSSKFTYPDDLREFIYTTYFSHIDPKNLNRDFYFDDYYLFMINILYTRFKHKDLIKYGMQRNGLLYHLSEEEAFRYMKIFLPVNVLVERESLKSYVALDLEFKTFIFQRIGEEEKTINASHWKEDVANISSYYEKIRHMLSCLFFFLLPKNTKTRKGKLACEAIFIALDEMGAKNNNTPYISWLKSRYFALCGEYKKALEYCETAKDNDKHRIGEHYKDLLTEGILLSAKCNSKDSYNKFYKLAKMEKILKYEIMLKIPTNAKVYTLIHIDESKEAFKRLSEECEQYYRNGFLD